MRFLSAVKEHDLNAMMQLWGSSNGLAVRRLGEGVARQRLTVIRIYLEHEEYAITVAPMNVVLDLEEGERVVFVRLNRKGCTPVVPFILAPYRGSWLVRSVDLEAAGNPARWCR